MVGFMKKSPKDDRLAKHERVVLSSHGLRLLTGRYQLHILRAVAFFLV